MTGYDITLKGNEPERVEGADAYAQEGQLTTFFRTSSSRQSIDCWSVRVASFRTSEILAVRRVELPDAAARLDAAPAAGAEVTSLRSA